MQRQQIIQIWNYDIDLIFKVQSKIFGTAQ